MVPGTCSAWPPPSCQPRQLCCSSLTAVEEVIARIQCPEVMDEEPGSGYHPPLTSQHAPVHNEWRPTHSYSSPLKGIGRARSRHAPTSAAAVCLEREENAPLCQGMPLSCPRQILVCVRPTPESGCHMGESPLALPPVLSTESDCLSCPCSVNTGDVLIP